MSSPTCDPSLVLTFPSTHTETLGRDFEVGRKADSVGNSIIASCPGHHLFLDLDPNRVLVVGELREHANSIGCAGELGKARHREGPVGW
jgi:hypothetical protein